MARHSNVEAPGLDGDCSWKFVGEEGGFRNGQTQLLTNINTRTMTRLTICALLLHTITPSWVWGQANIEGRRYFYHKVNISGNFFAQPKFAIDSVILFHSNSGDTLTYWTVGTVEFVNKRRLKEIEKSKEFGHYRQKGLTLMDGRITIHELRPTKFLIRNDSLFEWNETYRLSVDSIQSLRSIFESSQTMIEREKVSKVMDDNTEFGFVFIFSFDLFDNKPQQVIQDRRTKCFNRVTLLSKWSTDITDYYRFEITNDCGIWSHRWGYIVSKQFDFVAFGGYSSKEVRSLTQKNLVWNNSDAN